MAEPTSAPRTCVVPHADPKALHELQPLLRALEADTRPSEPLRFPRGTLLPDGRLDLCKQGLGPDGTRAVTRALQRNRFVTSLLMGADAMGNAGAEATAELLHENRSVTTVLLGCNQIDAQGASRLAKAVNEHPTLRGLWLKRNALGSAGVVALSEALRTNTHLRTLDLAQTQLDTEGGEALAAVLVGANHSIERLYLSGNQLNAHDTGWLARLVAGAPALNSVFLSANRLGDEGISALAPALRQNERLVELGIGSNGVSAAGWQALLEALRDHPGLRALDAGRSASAGPAGAVHDEVTDESVFFLAMLLRQTPRLQSLTIDGQKLSAKAIDLLLEALFENETLTHLNLQRRVTPAQRSRLQTLLERNRKRADVLAASEDVMAIRSVYRAGGGTVAAAPVKAPLAPPEMTEPLPEVPQADLETCVRVLQALTKQPGRFFDCTSGLNPVRAEANRLVEAIRGESEARRRTRSTAESKSAKAQRKAHDEEVIANTGMRQMRIEVMPMLPAPPKEAVPAGLLLKPRSCYVCKADFREVNAYYDSLCPSCATLNLAKREQTADLSGRTALLTGGRIKIGYEAALKLLRAGARVIMTTRFPCDAAKRFAREEDFTVWQHRLQIHGLDMRDVRAVERFAETLANDLDRLGILINNAAQTVRRPSEYYRHLLEAEARGRGELPPHLQGVVAEQTYHSAQEPVPAAALSQVPLLPEDLVRDTSIFPLASFDRHGQQRDLRAINSWTLELGQIATNEVLETHYVNAIAPFILINRLMPLMERTPGRKFVVNVSAMEGKFDYARKQTTHPHTNMAKASLNMLTRTAASSLAERGIYMTSVDTGWVTNENPHPLTEAMRANLNFEPPLDEIDGAARVLDPVFSAGDQPQFGLFLKDYKPAGW